MVDVLKIVKYYFLCQPLYVVVPNYNLFLWFESNWEKTKSQNGKKPSIARLVDWIWLHQILSNPYYKYKDRWI